MKNTPRQAANVVRNRTDEAAKKPQRRVPGLKGPVGGEMRKGISLNAR